jgi:porin
MKLFFLITLPLFFVLSAQADEQKKYANTITGDWSGKRTRLAENGIDIQLNYTLDSFAISGGIKNGTSALDEIDFTTRIDGEKLWGIEGSSAKVYFYRNDFGHPNRDYVGSLQGIDSDESNHDFTHLDEAWLQQNFLGNKYSILAGLYDFTYEFYQTASSGMFLNPTFDVGSEFAFSGGNGGSIYASNSMAIRLKALPTDSSYIQVAVMDGIPSTPYKPKRPHRLYTTNGALVLAEGGLTPNNDQYSIGAWTYTKGVPDLVTNQNKNSYGVYALLEKELYKNPENPNESLTGFIRAGKTYGSTTTFDYAWSGGINYAGLFSSREHGVLGLAILQAANSSNLIQQEFSNGVNLKSRESGIEITYQDYIIPGLLIQPDIQYIFNPSGNPTAKNALVLGLRTKFFF